MSTRFSGANLDPNGGGPEYSKVVEDLTRDDESRSNFLKACLAKLGLTVSQEVTPVPSLSRLHLSSLHHYLVPELLSSWEDIITKEDGEEYIKGENDTFHLEKKDSRWSLNSLVQSLPTTSVFGGKETQAANQLGGDGSDDRIVDFSNVTKHLVPHETEWPETKETPCFNHNAFYANLRYYQNEKSSEAEVFGKYLMYGEVVTSTNTMLEKLVFV